MIYRLKKIVTALFSTRQNVPVILNNVFGKKHRRTALLSYIRDVFTDEALLADTQHTNRYTTYLIAEVLDDLGFNVDVINYDSSFPGNFADYDLVIGLGRSLDEALASRENCRKPLVFWFGTGCSPLFSNRVTLERVQNFYRQSGKVLLESSRYIKEDWPLQHTVSDHIFLHGQEFANSTYAHQSISCLNGPVFISEKATAKKNFQDARRNFLWFGTGGLLHKGLDLVIDAFEKRRDCKLHICGDLQREPGFYNYYRETIENCGNIHWHGFVNVRSDAFLSILSQCAFVVFPSASEGNSPSVLTCMANGGLIPVVTRSADVDARSGILIEELSTEAVGRAVSKALEIPEADLSVRAEQILRSAAQINTFDYFRKDFSAKLLEALNNVNANG